MLSSWIEMDLHLVNNNNNTSFQEAQMDNNAIWVRI